MTPATKFVILCYAAARELLRKQRTALQAKTARSKKGTAVPFLNLLAGLPGSSLSEESPESSQSSSPANRTAGPTREAPRGLLDGLPPYFETNKGKSGKS